MYYPELDIITHEERPFTQGSSFNNVERGVADMGNPISQPSADATQVDGTHYKDMPMQPWDVMEAVLTPEEFRGFLKGNIIKYSMRAGHKEGAHKDGDKARHYTQKLREVQA